MAAVDVGLIGLGAVGGEVATQLAAGAAGPVSLTALVRRDVAVNGPVRCVTRVEALIAVRPALVVEAAGHAAVATHVPALLRAGVPVIVVSVGALADDALHARLNAAEREGNTRLILPAGAIGGLDYLRAVARSRGLRVRYCSRKPVAAWRRELTERSADPDSIRDEFVLFEGSARQAALSFPQNLNVAVTLALAAAGLDATSVRVVADPRARGNTHEIDIESAAGRARFVFENAPSAGNPKTSALTALSVVEQVRATLAERGLLAIAEPVPS